MAYQAEKALNELGDQVPSADRQQIEGKIAQLREALKGEDADQIKQLTEQVQQASYALSQQLYQTQTQAESGPREKERGPEDEDVAEGESKEM